MKPLAVITLALAALASACQTAAPRIERLAPRATEAIDPRAPIPEAEPSGPASPALVAELGRLRAQALASTAEFDRLAAAARGAAAGAGAPQSESWIVAEQALSALVAAGGPLTRALGDVDALAAARIGRLAAPDRKAIETVSAELATIAERQATVIAALSARLRG